MHIKNNVNKIIFKIILYIILLEYFSFNFLNIGNESINAGTININELNVERLSANIVNQSVCLYTNIVFINNNNSFNEFDLKIIQPIITIINVYNQFIIDGNLFNNLFKNSFSNNNSKP